MQHMGAQNISQEDLALPFLKILGQLSPEVNKRDGKYVEGAEPGKIINTVTNELYDTYKCHTMSLQKTVHRMAR